MEQCIFELLEASAASSPSFWVPIDDEIDSSLSTDGISDLNSKSQQLELHEPNEDFTIQPGSLVMTEGYFSATAQNNFLLPQSLVTEARRKLASSQRRRVQNRKSQQAFRERQAQRVKTLEQSVEELLKKRDEYDKASWRVEILEGTIKELLIQKEELEKSYLDLEAKYGQLKEDIKWLTA